MSQLLLKLGFMLFLTCICSVANAQKLPKTQKNSLRIPDNVKVDGRATELNNTFQAYNDATSLYYTISNDDENLYVAFQAIQPRVIGKILSSGITFVVNALGKEKDNGPGNMIITYPDLTVNDSQIIISKLGIKIQNGFNVLKKGEQPKPTDSAVAVINKLITAKANTIKIFGIKDIPDSTLSVYNMGGIKAVAAINTEQDYTYELILPLKLLGLSVNQTKPFSYEIKVLSRVETGKKYGVVTGYSNGVMISDINADLDTTTNFWGEYTLAKNK